MNDAEQQEFRQLFRKLIERNSLVDADKLLHRAINLSDDPSLISLAERTTAQIHIDRWSSINVAMKNARDGLVRGRMGAMILSLVHRNWQESDMTVEVTFAKSAEEAPFDERLSSFFGRQGDSKEEWLSKARAWARLPARPYQGPALHAKPKLLGLEDVRDIYRRKAEPGEGYKERVEPIHTAQMLASNLVFLRFCQTAEGHLICDTSVPRLPTFLTVEMAERPMETGTIDYCDHAVRIVID